MVIAYKRLISHTKFLKRIEQLGSLTYKWGDQDLEFLSEMHSDCLGSTPAETGTQVSDVIITIV